MGIERFDLISALRAVLSQEGQKNYFLPYETPVKIKTKVSLSFSYLLCCSKYRENELCSGLLVHRLDPVRLEEKREKLF